MATFTVTTANIRDTGIKPDPLPIMTAVKRRIAEAAEFDGVVFGQEIEKASYDAAWNAGMKAAGKVTFCQDSECPISLPQDGWEIVDSETMKVHDGLDHISPHRDITKVKAVHKASGFKFAFLNFHPLSKPGQDPEGAWRSAMWNKYHAFAAKQIRALHDKGYTVVYGGDANKTKPAKYHPLQQTLIESGLDHLWIVPATGLQLSGKPAKTKLPTTPGKQMDHPILSVTFDLVAAKPEPPVVPPVVTPPIVVTPPVVVPPVVKPPAVKVNQAQRVIAEATKHLGFREGAGRGNNNDNPFAKNMGWANFQAWCASFVCSNFKDAGLLDLIKTPSAGVDQLSVGFKRAGRWSEYPAVGAVAFYGRPTDLNHTGIVVRYDDTFIWAVEGNTNADGGREGHSVLMQKRARRSNNVVGYGYPEYAEGITSADPKFAKVTTKPKPPATTKPRAVKPELADISHHQAKVDLRVARDAGLIGLYHKATEGETFHDDRYNERRDQAKRLRLPFGGYHFARPDASKGDGRDEARFFLDFAKPLPGDLPGALDLEDRAGVTKWKLDREELTVWVGDFVAEYKRQVGALPLLYNVFDLNDTFGCRIWVPRYNDAMKPPVIPAPWKSYDMWQFTNGVAGKPNSFPGLGHVDLNTRAAGVTLAKLTIPAK